MSEVSEFPRPGHHGDRRSHSVRGRLMRSGDEQLYRTTGTWPVTFQLGGVVTNTPVVLCRVCPETVAVCGITSEDVSCTLLECCTGLHVCGIEINDTILWYVSHRTSYGGYNQIFFYKENFNLVNLRIL